MSQETTAVPQTKIIIGPVRISYAHVWKPTAMEEGATLKYSVSLIIPKDDKETVAKINAAIEAAKMVGKAILTDKKTGKLLPDSRLKLPLNDGDIKRPDDAVYANSYYLTANSITKPGIVSLEKDAEGKFKQITDESQVYSGCWCRVSVNFYAYPKGNIGIAVGLNNIQKVRDGEPLGGRSSADADFDDDFANDDDDL